MAKKKSSAYWKDRFAILEEASNSYGQDAYRKIEPAFDKAQRQIQKEIESWYGRYARNNNISIDEARKHLTSAELKELKWDVQEYIRYGRENDLNQQWMKELENASAKFHINRLEALKLRTRHAVEVAFGNELDEIDAMARKVFSEDYYHSIFEVQKGFNIGWEIGQIDERKLDKIISRPWTTDNRTFKDRIWTSKDKMVTELHQQLTRNMVLGKAPDEAIKEMSKYVDKDFKNAKYAAGRLVMTEQAYFHSVSQKEAFNDLDVEEFEIVATLDSHTSEVCQDMDGQHFPMKEYEPGVTAPPFHVFCRSVTVPYFDDEFSLGERAARDEDGQTYYVPSDMKYKDWKKSLVDGDTKVLTNIGKGVKIDIQFFAEKDIANQESGSLKRAMRKYLEKISLHQDKINNPEKYVEGWENKDVREQNGLIKHWQKEIRNFQTSIDDRIVELKKRGDYDE
jgi:SPP1 gp7 family putative phage head morphogenesis protein